MLNVGEMGAKGIGRGQVLVIDDEPALAGGLKMILTEEGYLVDVALTGTDALESLKNRTFDLVVTDLKLPDVNGLEIVRQVKRNTPETEVVVITGYPSVESAMESTRMGVREYLEKPFTDEELIAAVGAALSASEAVKEEILTGTDEGRLIQKREVLRVLDRVSIDRKFQGLLAADPAAALRGYQLSSAAQAAVGFGDLAWVGENVGELTAKQVQAVCKLLEREAW